MLMWLQLDIMIDIMLYIVNLKLFYNSENFHIGKKRVKAIKLRIIDHVDQGVTNENSFKNQAGSPVFKRVQSDYPDAWKQPLRRWLEDYFRSVPLESLKETDEDV